MPRVRVETPAGFYRSGDLVAIFYKHGFRRCTVKMDDGSVIEVNAKRVSDEVDPLDDGMWVFFTILKGVGLFLFCVIAFYFFKFLFFLTGLLVK